MPLIRSYPPASELDPTDAFVLDRIGTGTMYIEGLNLIAGAPYVAAFEFLGDPALTSEILGAHTFTLAAAFTANLFGAVGFCDPASLPTATFVADIYHIAGAVSTHIGTMTISTHGAFTFSVAVAPTFAAGDSIKFVGPTVIDATATNFWWSLLGAVAS